MKKYILLSLVAFFCLAHVATAQRYTLKGQVQDENQTGLPGATVLILQAKDSSLVSFTSTNQQGGFEIKNVNKGDLLIKTTFLGYSPYFQKLQFPEEGNQLDMGALQLRPLSNELKEVMVQGEKSPVVFKKD
ncbi:MAG: carboxypeptidase-like regulatory domain-containing protein, partial [Pontibacter sp.]|nr:carboxypeptidase-like regulatory domain-containing protein [Pontibacter sp.]